ncbi:MAG: hypothetical protein JWM96_1112 [Alphaproteobacteria bacterium]|nr:hypothetical protein [Alphaproteobacteria bacterium]
MFKKPVIKESSAVIRLIVDADTIEFYSSIDSAESDLEYWIVEEGILKAAYGPEGQIYKIGLKEFTHF